MAFRRIGNPNTLTQQENSAAKTRAITGDGTAFLKVPGLLVLTAVAVATASGRMELPIKEDRLIMVHTDQEQPREKVEEELFLLETEGYDEAILLRSELSNGGIWQKGVEFYITGEWIDDTATSTDPAPSAGTSKTPTPVASSPSNTQTEKSVKENTPKDEKTEDEDPSFVQVEALASLPEDLKAKIATFGSLEAAKEAVEDTTNEKFKATGITGPDILKARNALKAVLAAAEAQGE